MNETNATKKALPLRSIETLEREGSLDPFGDPYLEGHDW